MKLGFDMSLTVYKAQALSSSSSFFLCSYIRFVALCIGWDNSGGNYEHFNERFKLNNGWHDWFLRLRRMLGSAFAFREQYHGAEQPQSLRKPLSEQYRWVAFMLQKGIVECSVSAPSDLSLVSGLLYSRSVIS